MKSASGLIDIKLVDGSDESSNGLDKSSYSERGIAIVKHVKRLSGTKSENHMLNIMSSNQKTRGP